MHDGFILTSKNVFSCQAFVSQLRILLKEADGNIPALALAVGLGTQRVRDALDGILPLGPEMSAHIEHTCHLPGAWLDHPDTELPARAKQRIQKALNGDDLDDDDYEEEAAAAPAPVAQPAAAPAVAQEQDSGLRVVQQTPVIKVRRRRTTQAEELAPVAPPALAVAQPSLPEVPEPTAEQVQAPRRGRKAGIKSVDTSLDTHRREWLVAITQPKGSKSQLCRLLQAPDSFVAHLLSGRRTFTDKITEKIELVMGLEPGTIDKWTPADTAPVLPSAVMPVSAGVADIEKAVAMVAALAQPSATIAVAPEPVAPAPVAAEKPAPAPAPVAPKQAALVVEAKPTPAPAPVAAAPAPALTAPPAFLTAPVAAAVKEAANKASRLDAGLEAALQSMLKRAIAENKLSNQVAVKLLQELALLID